MLKNEYVHNTWAESFTSLMTDLHKEMNRVFSFSRYLEVEHFLEGIASIALISYDFLYINVKSRQLLNAKPPFAS